MEYDSLYFIQGVLLIGITPLFIGILRKFKANIRGYQGCSIFQFYFDLSKLMQKGKVHSSSSSFITIIGPAFSFAAAILAAFLVPVFYTKEINSFGNIFIVIFLMSIIKFMNTFIGLDCASTFGGMGSSREMFISLFAEPILFVLIAFLYFETKSFNIYTISFINSIQVQYTLPHFIAATAFIPLFLAENARMPVDNPETHLELTMMHEAMILDLSGSDLAFVELAASIKFMVFLSIFINGFFPFSICTSLTILACIKALLIYVIKLLCCLLGIAMIETLMAKYRLFRVPDLLAAALSIGMVGLATGYFL